MAQMELLRIIQTYASLDTKDMSRLAKAHYTTSGYIGGSIVNKKLICKRCRTIQSSRLNNSPISTKLGIPGKGSRI